MQLLKLTQTYNTTFKSNTTKQNPKNQYMTILEKCIHVPKDDRLVLRRYLSSLSLRQLQQNNEVIAILLKYASKKGKENVDKKLQVLLRKQADRIRKQDQLHIILNKMDEAPQKTVNRCTPIDPRKYCNNFQLMKSSVRNHSSKKSSDKQNIRSLNQSRELPIKQMRFKSRVIENFKTYKEESNKKSRNNSSLADRELTSPKTYSKLKQISSNFNINLNKLANEENSEDFTELRQIRLNERQNKISQLRHRPTKSRSLGDIIMNYNQNYPLDQSMKYQVCSQYVKEENLQEYGSLRQSQNLQTSSVNLSLSNFNSFSSNININSNITSLYSTIHLAPKSPHLQLKQLKICSQDFHDFLIPVDTKFSRTPSDLSIPYSEFIQKLSLYISNAIQISNQTIYIPFVTQYDLVTFQKLSQFLNEYTYPRFKNNSVRDLFTRLQIGVGGYTQGFSEMKKISIEEFKKAYQWKKPLIRNKFEQLVKRCNRWCTNITYWEFYWLKDSSQYKQFDKQFHSD